MRWCGQGITRDREVYVRLGLASLLDVAADPDARDPCLDRLSGGVVSDSTVRHLPINITVTTGAAQIMMMSSMMMKTTTMTTMMMMSVVA